MADILNVLAAPQTPSAGKSANPGSGQTQDSTFGGMLSARMDEAREAESSPDPAAESATPAAASAKPPSTGERAIDTPALPAEVPPAVQAGTESQLLMQLMVPVTGVSLPAMPGAPRSLGSLPPPLPLSAQAAATPAATDTLDGQDLPLTERSPSTAEAPLRSIAGFSTTAPVPAANFQSTQNSLPGNEGTVLSATAVMEATESIDLTGLDHPPAPLPVIDQSAQAARHLGQFEQTARVPEPRVQVAVDAPVRSPAFATEFSEKIVWMTGRQTQLADISLNPPQLGAIEVRLSLNGGEAGAQFFSANASVRDAIESALPKLREMLAQAGINLGDSHVRDEAFAQREPGESRQFGNNGQRSESAFTSVSHPVVSRSGIGLVDLYA